MKTSRKALFLAAACILGKSATAHAETRSECEERAGQWETESSDACYEISLACFEEAQTNDAAAECADAAVQCYSTVSDAYAADMSLCEGKEC